MGGGDWEGSKVALPHSKVYIRCGGLDSEYTQLVYVATFQIKLTYVVLLTGWDVARRSMSDVQRVRRPLHVLHIKM